MRVSLSFLIGCICLALSTNAQAQQVFDTRLTAVYELAWLEKMQTDNPKYLERLVFYANEGFSIVDVITDKPSITETVQIADLANINIYMLEREQKTHRLWDLPKMYRIAGTNKMLVYRSGRDMVKAWNKREGLKTPNLNRAVKFEKPTH